MILGFIMIVVTILVPIMVCYGIGATIDCSRDTVSDIMSNLGISDAIVLLLIFLLYAVQTYLSWWRPMHNSVAIYLIIAGMVQIIISCHPDV